MKHWLIATSIIAMLISPSTVMAQKKDVVTVPKSTEYYTIHDKDGNSVSVRFDVKKTEIRIVVNPKEQQNPTMPAQKEEVIIIPLDSSSDERVGGSGGAGVGGSGFSIIVKPISYTDIDNHWARNDILEMSALGLIKGYPDGTFRPNNSISRAEFAALVERILQMSGIKKEGEQPLSRFKDVSQSDWFYMSVNWLENRGNIPNAYYQNGLLKPNEPITREEMAVWLAKEVTSDSIVPAFKDQYQIRFKEEVRKITAAGLLKGYPDNTFRPQGQTTRAEAVTILMRFLRMKGIHQ